MRASKRTRRSTRRRTRSVSKLCRDQLLVRTVSVVLGLPAPPRHVVAGVIESADLRRDERKQP